MSDYIRGGFGPGTMRALIGALQTIARAMNDDLSEEGEIGVVEALDDLGLPVASVALSNERNAIYAEIERQAEILVNKYQIPTRVLLGPWARRILGVKVGGEVCCAVLVVPARRRRPSRQ